MGSDKMISGHILPAQEKAFLELHKRNVLKWLPWVGNGYEPGGLLVVGETNYANDDSGATPSDAVANVNGNWRFTHDVVDRFCLSRRNSNRTFDVITHLLKESDAAKAAHVSAEVWQSLAYMDLIQTAMKGRGWENGYKRNAIERPQKQLWKPGWEALIEVIRILKPGSLLFVGAGLACKCNGKFLPNGTESHIANVRKVGKTLWMRARWIKPSGETKIDIVSIPNPGGTHGFVCKSWRKALLEYGKQIAIERK